MWEIIAVLVIAIIAAALLFALVKKVLRIAIFLVLVAVIFIVLANFLFPDLGMAQKGKNYILEKAGAVLDKGKETVTSYVIIETNDTVNKVKENILKDIG